MRGLGMAGDNGRLSLPCPGARRVAWRRGRKTRWNSHPGFRWGSELGPVRAAAGEARGARDPAGCSGNFLWDIEGIKRGARCSQGPGQVQPRVPVPRPLHFSYHLCHFEQGALGERVHRVQQSLRGLAWPRRAAAAARGPDEPRSMRHRATQSRPAASEAPGPLAGKAGTGRGGASGAGPTDPSSQLRLDPERTQEQMPRKPLPSRHAEVGLAWAGNRTPGALASPRSAPPRSQLVTSLQGFLCVCVWGCGCGCC